MGTFTQDSAGSVHPCAIDPTGAVQCWGYDLGGQSAPPAGTFTQVSAGYMHSCATLETFGAALCWGENYVGQLHSP